MPHVAARSIDRTDELPDRLARRHVGNRFDALLERPGAADFGDSLPSSQSRNNAWALAAFGGGESDDEEAAIPIRWEDRGEPRLTPHASEAFKGLAD